MEKFGIKSMLTFLQQFSPMSLLSAVAFALWGAVTTELPFSPQL
jgi:hypothetical protein